MSSAPAPNSTTPAPASPPGSNNSTSSPPPPPPPSTTAPSPRSSPPPPPPTNSSAPPPSTTLSPPPPTATSPTPSPPPPATPSASPPPPPATPSASPPPPTTPSASPPPPATPSASPPPPATPSASPPPPATPSSPTPPTPSPPPPPSNTPSPPSSTTPSPPLIRSSPPPPASSRTPLTPVARNSPPPPASQASNSGGVSIGLVVGLAAAAVVVVVALTLLFSFYLRKKRRREDDVGYYMPPPPPSGSKGGSYGGQQYGQQQNIPLPPGHHFVAAAPKPPPSPPTFTSSSGGTTSNNSASPLQPPSPGLVLNFSKNAFTYEELARATNGFSDANLLGQGGFGYVHKGVLPSGKEVAVKQLKAGSGQGEREFQAEVEIISRVHHRHLVSLVGYCMTGTQRLLVYEFVPNNTLQFHLHGEGRPTLDWPSRLKIALGSARGLAYLHEDCHPKIIHRDIKAANILLDFKFEAQVADFGLAKLASDTDTHVSTRVMGTFGYLAPEYAQSGKLTDKSDVFSFGVVLLELITGRKPVDSSNTFNDDSLVDWARPLLNRAMEDGNFDSLADPRLNNQYNRDEMAQMVACAAACVRHSARRRPRMSQVVRALEGEMSLSNLNEGIRPGHRSMYSSESTDYDTVKYNEHLRIFQRMAFGASQGYSLSSELSRQSSGMVNPSGSSGEQTTREMEMGKTKTSGQGFSGSS